MSQKHENVWQHSIKIRVLESMKYDKKIDVIYIITKLELGGAQKVCLSLFKGVKSENITTHLITGDSGPLIKEIVECANVSLLKTLSNTLSLRGVWNELSSAWIIAKTIRTIKKKNPSVIVHTHSSKAGIIGRWAAFLAGVKHRIHTVHGYALHPHMGYVRWLFFYTIELFTSFITTHYVCVSSEDVKTGIELFPFFSKKHSIIRAAVDTHQFCSPATITTTSLEKDLFIFGTIACFKPQKNIFDLLHAFKTIHSQYPHTRLQIIGDGHLRSAIETWIEHHNLQTSITLLGWQDEVAPFMKQWNCFVLTSLWEGLPCAIIEARLLKIPVISYNTGGIKDVIFHGQNGLLIPQKDIERMADAMKRIMYDTSLYTSFVSYNDDLSEFDNSAMIKNHQDLYTRL
jgi:glycosyltransferase involved in cell wall biosynthesis